MLDESPVAPRRLATGAVIATIFTIFAGAIALNSLLSHRAAGADTADDGVAAGAGHDKYSVKVTGGLAFAEFRGYEGWQVVAVSRREKAIAVILANPLAIAAYRDGIPRNGKPFPDGSKMVKIHWDPKVSETAPTPTTVPGTQQNVDFMVRDGKRFADSGGWGWAAFEYDLTSGTFRPATLSDLPPQANDAKCGLGCHTIVKSKDYVFTEYATR